MIKQFGVERFKSIKQLSLECVRVNVFIGEPDTGKTTILEALGLASCLGWQQPIGPRMRLSSEMGFEALFFRQFVNQPVLIQLNETLIEFTVRGRNAVLKVGSKGAAEIDFSGILYEPEFSRIRAYTYAGSEVWSYVLANPDANIVVPPHGANLTYILKHNSEVYEFFKGLISGLDLRLKFDQTTKKFRAVEIRNDEVLEYNLELLSDSVRRLLFYGAIILTSKDAVLVMDEPDVYAFPPYPKNLGEMIADDESNQYFLTTHNPYFLSALMEKTKAAELAVYVCHRDREGATQATRLKPAQVEEAIDQGQSVFFNLKHFIAP